MSSSGANRIFVVFCDPYATYCKRMRTHRSLNKDAPISRPVHRIRIISSRPILGGLRQGLGFQYTQRPSRQSRLIFPRRIGFPTIDCAATHIKAIMQRLLMSALGRKQTTAGISAMSA